MHAPRQLTIFAALLTILVGAIPASAGSRAVAGQVSRTYEPRFEAAPCPTDVPGLETARCGFLVVPESRSGPSDRTIRLVVAVIPAVAAASAPEPLVYLTGGPGGIALFEAHQLVQAGFNSNQDLVLMNQRGTYLSEPALTCPVIDEFNKRLRSLRYDAESIRREHLAATRACREQLAAQGIDLGTYNTTENAADFADLQRALGHERWNVFGVSYGSSLALTLMRDHPDGIRSRLDGAAARCRTG